MKMIYHDFYKEIDERSIQLGLKNDEIWPILDGPFNEKVYSQQTNKILYILKEPYDDKNAKGQPYGGGWKLGAWEKSVTYKDVKPRTLTMLSYLTYGFYDNKEYKDIPYPYDDNAVPSSLLKTGIINTGKMPAHTSTSNARLNKIAQEWMEIDMKQLKEYNPDIMVFGGTYDLYSYSLGLLGYYHKVNEDGVYGYSIKDDKLYISAYHPSAFVNQNNYINRLLSIMREFTKSV